ncbi:hypothetical protein Tco_0858980 [Tanacetum coccineum]|uniref:Tf2-1-like SH3-like domain-containing protein n=1 Tax=Tanacetum coccineum TaxID=301880 RepID=A0ABQ5BDN6_9ASTR
MRQQKCSCHGPTMEKGILMVPLVGSKMDEAHASRYLVHPGADKKYYNLGDILRYLSENEIESPWILSLNFQDAAESVRDAIGFEYCLASSSGWTKSLILWTEIGESSLTGLELVQETTDKVVLVKEKPKAILERIGLVAYRLSLPEELNSVHDTFHVSNLKKCLADANLYVPLDEIKADKTLHFVKEPVEIMD